MRRSHGFTLIEVMVAVAILGLGLASLFTSQVGAIKVAQRARTTTVATLLARCKMAEIEERLMERGLPFDDISESDECCEDLEQEGFECDWAVERILLPEADLDSDEEGGFLDSLTQEAEDTGEPEPEDLTEEGVSGVLGGSMGMGGILDMVTQMSTPVLKPVFEEQVRRAEVTVRWYEGDKEHSFDVVQFVVAEQGAPPPSEEDSLGGGSAGGTGGTTAGGGALQQ